MGIVLVCTYVHAPEGRIHGVFTQWTVRSAIGRENIALEASDFMQLSEENRLVAFSRVEAVARNLDFESAFDAVCPPIRHLYPFIPIERPMISAAHVVSTGVAQFGFNGVRIPKPCFVQHR